MSKPIRKKEKAAIRSRLAVIDIGSNSVRLVIFDVYGTAMLSYFNQKAMAGLGKGLVDTGHLSVDGKRNALLSLRRFAAILSGLGVNRVKTVATAAVRSASDGAEFVQQVKEQTGLEVTLLSGEEEALASAAGVAAGFRKPKGVIGDLGGSSVEFAGIGKTGITSAESFDLGPLAFSGAYDADSRRQIIAEQLKTSSLITPDQRGRTFYLVGGAWRALAKLHMDLNKYGLRYLHAYSFSAHDIGLLVEAVHATDPVSRERVEKHGGRRAEILPYAAILLEEIVKRSQFGTITVSAYGVREGLVRQEIGTLSRDLLKDGIELVARPTPSQWAFGEALYAFVQPALSADPDLFGKQLVGSELIEAACYLSDIGARFHPNSRAQLSHDTVVEGSWAGISHQERAFLALAVGNRYSRRLKLKESMAAMLPGPLATRAQQVGALMRLGATISGRTPDLMKLVNIARSGDRLILRLSKSGEFLVSDTVERRLEYAAQLFDLKSAIEIGG